MARRAPFPPSSMPAYSEQSMKLFVLRGSKSFRRLLGAVGHGASLHWQLHEIKTRPRNACGVRDTCLENVVFVSANADSSHAQNSAQSTLCLGFGRRKTRSGPVVDK
jgi:hypothetical protein